MNYLSQPITGLSTKISQLFQDRSNHYSNSVRAGQTTPNFGYCLQQIISISSGCWRREFYFPPAKQYLIVVRHAKKTYEYENFLHRLGFSDMEARKLNIENKWFEDGPLLPIEFTRQSDNGRMTLIIDNAAKPVRTLWALMTSENS